MRVLIDYRPALRQRSGAGEYTHQLVKALSALDDGLELAVFSSSWKDRLIDVGELGAVDVVDRRVPVRVLNFAWHRLGWPPAETIARGRFDVTHSSHPLILPARHAAHVITIHDLNFLSHPERTQAEIRRDYPALVHDHARRADGIIVPSQFTAGEVERRLGVERARIAVCPVGAPAWQPRAQLPKEGYVLFVGTLEPRKNVSGLLDAYERLIVGPPEGGHDRRMPPLLLAGNATEAARPWLDRLDRPPLKGIVRHLGYVDPSRTRELYEGARLLVLPSFEEGFGIPVLEAMTVGVPVVAARRGSLPEILGDAGVLVDPERPDEIADAIARMLDDDELTTASVARGIARSREYRWDRTARRVHDAYREAIEAHAHRH